MKKGKWRRIRVFLSIIAIGALITGFLGTVGYAAVTDATKASVAALATAGNWQGIANMAAADPELSAALDDVLAGIAATMPDQAAAIAAGMASVMPERAAAIAAAIARAVPARAAEIAAAVATAVPSQAEGIAVAVAAVVPPDQATGIANAVAAVVPDRADAILAAVREAARNRGTQDVHEGRPSYGQ